MNCRNMKTCFGAMALGAAGLMFAMATAAMAQRPGLLRRHASADTAKESVTTTSPDQPSFVPPVQDAEAAEV